MILKVEGQWMDREGLTYDYFEGVRNPRVLVDSFRNIEKTADGCSGLLHWYLRADGPSNDLSAGATRDEIADFDLKRCSALNQDTATILVTWVDDEDNMHHAICNTKAYLMNDSGKTIERLI